MALEPSNDTMLLDGKVIRRRWRKSTATWVLYYRGRIVESGFNTDRAAFDHIIYTPSIVRKTLAAIDAEFKS